MIKLLCAISKVDEFVGTVSNGPLVQIVLYHFGVEICSGVLGLRCEQLFEALAVVNIGGACVCNVGDGGKQVC